MKTLSLGSLEGPLNLVTSHQTKAGPSDAVPVLFVPDARNQCVVLRLWASLVIKLSRAIIRHLGDETLKDPFCASLLPAKSTRPRKTKVGVSELVSERARPSRCRTRLTVPVTRCDCSASQCCERPPALHRFYVFVIDGFVVDHGRRLAGQPIWIVLQPHSSPSRQPRIVMPVPDGSAPKAVSTALRTPAARSW
jgi:hypothetical protein